MPDGISGSAAPSHLRDAQSAPPAEHTSAAPAGSSSRPPVGPNARTPSQAAQPADRQALADLQARVAARLARMQGKLQEAHADVADIKADASAGHQAASNPRLNDGWRGKALTYQTAAAISDTLAPAWRPPSPDRSAGTPAPAASPGPDARASSEPRAEP